MLSPEDIANITVSVLFVSAFICIFFFTYVVKIEEEVIENQIDFIVKDLVDDLSLVPKEYMAEAKQKIKNIKPADMSNADEKVAKNNKEIFWNVLKLTGIGLIVGMILVYISSRYFEFSMKDILIRNIIILIFIGLTEFVFVSTIAHDYISADPNFVKYTVINRVQQIIS